MMKKNLAIILACMMGLGIMAGCSQAKTAQDTISSSVENLAEDTTGETEYVDDAVITSGVLTGSECIPFYTWQAKDGSYIRLTTARTYKVYDKDGKTDGKVGFWKPVDEKSICLMDGNLKEITTLINEDIDDGRIVNADGEEFVATDRVPDGTYSCMMNHTYLDGDQLTITASVPFWIANSQVPEIKAGTILNYSDNECMGTEVVKLYKVDDTHYVINDYMNLTYDKNADAWLFDVDLSSYERIGTCQIKDEAMLKALKDAMEKEEFVFPDVTVENGVVTSISIN